jgi:DNA-binding NarL/FixJ family response regulator
MDINLPDMNRVEGVRQLSPLAPNARILMLTEREDPDSIFHSLRRGLPGIC